LHDLQLHPGVARQKIIDQIGQQGYARWGGEAHPATRFAGQVGHGFLGLFGLQQHGLAMAQVAFADIGQCQFACRALQQTRAKALLQLGDAPRQARFGDAQGTPGSGETTGFHYLGEVEQIIEVMHVIVLSVGRTIAFLPSYRLLVPSVASVQLRHHVARHSGEHL